MDNNTEWYTVPNKWFDDNGIYKSMCNNYALPGSLALCLPHNTSIPYTADLLLVYVIAVYPGANLFVLRKVYTNGTVDQASFRYNAQPLYEVPDLLDINLIVNVDFGDPK
jgi:hypothetical protein